MIIWRCRDCSSGFWGVIRTGNKKLSQLVPNINNVCLYDCHLWFFWDCEWFCFVFFFFFGGVEVDAESRGGDALGLLIKSELFSMNGIQGFFLSIQYRLPPFPHLDVSVNLLFPRLLFPPLWTFTLVSVPRLLSNFLKPGTFARWVIEWL